jgi:hypothetical protein
MGKTEEHSFVRVRKLFPPASQLRTAAHSCACHSSFHTPCSTRSPPSVQSLHQEHQYCTPARGAARRQGSHEAGGNPQRTSLTPPVPLLANIHRNGITASQPASGLLTPRKYWLLSKRRGQFTAWPSTLTTHVYAPALRSDTRMMYSPGRAALIIVSACPLLIFPTKLPA